MTPSETLVMEHQCSRLVLEMARLNDAAQFMAAAELFASDAVLFHPLQPDVPLRGRVAIAEALQHRPSHMLSHHVCTNIIIDVEADGQAHGQTYYTVYLQPGGAVRSQPFVFDGTVYVGTYQDKYIRTVDGWKISERVGRHRLLWQPETAKNPNP